MNHWLVAKSHSILLRSVGRFGEPRTKLRRTSTKPSDSSALFALDPISEFQDEKNQV
jgi:hypothetical protein